MPKSPAPQRQPAPLVLVMPDAGDMIAAVPLLAYEAATAAMQRLGQDSDYLLIAWPTMATDMRPGDELEIARAYAAYVRDNPDAPAESLFRYGRKTGVHSIAGDQWPDLPPLVRVAHELFCSCVRMLDRAIDRIEAERIMAERKAHLAANGPPAPQVAEGRKSIFRKSAKQTDRHTWGKPDETKPWTLPRPDPNGGGKSPQERTSEAAGPQGVAAQSGAIAGQTD